MLLVYVKHLDGVVEPVEIEPSATVRELVAVITHEKVHSLALHGKTLAMDADLADTGISSECQLQVPEQGVAVPLSEAVYPPPPGICSYLAEEIANELPQEEVSRFDTVLTRHLVVHDMESNGGGCDIEDYGPGKSMLSRGEPQVQTLWSQCEQTITVCFCFHTLQLSHIAARYSDVSKKLVEFEVLTEVPCVTSEGPRSLESRTAWREMLKDADWVPLSTRVEVVGQADFFEVQKESSSMPVRAIRGRTGPAGLAMNTLEFYGSVMDLGLRDE